MFVQGWPDDASLWDDTVAALGAKYRCVRVNLPNYGGIVTTRWGHDTEEIVDALVQVPRGNWVMKDPSFLGILERWLDTTSRQGGGAPPRT